jgi:hypothetical protein
MSVHTLDSRELATVLAALRYWQRLALAQEERGPEDDIASDGGTLSILQPSEIDALCERINCEDAPIVKVRVSGGVVQEVETPLGLVIKVFDYDHDDGSVDPATLDKDDDGNACTIATYGGDNGA